jgi:acetylornithine deacetylase/succinyl-diaminopimelate desuccinylase-like protein
MVDQVIICVTRKITFMVKQYIEKNKERFLSELFEWLRIPSISADSRHKQDVRRAAEFLRERLIVAGVDNIEICETKDIPSYMLKR